MHTARSKISLHSLSPSFCFSRLSPFHNGHARRAVVLVGWVGVMDRRKGFCISSLGCGGDPVVRRCQTTVSSLADVFRCGGVRVWRKCNGRGEWTLEQLFFENMLLRESLSLTPHISFLATSWLDEYSLAERAFFRNRPSRGVAVKREIVSE
jgi:hypothetical protein